ncbi:ketoacyl-synt-domain-containing protein [Aspergillus steynii IBT 23096]|uniref:Ketoacyl-synt-domain-containing protein n=1 Tax=Aspergillus steynii IBT 23096 TaxID=1392250 RepID=A0A2I2GKP9_9EURO|nr:ketoacyl-synt-domain-containing protein [Aspergillus steynii IBT 23096]PLB53458.1 ketoacyl-synt-domain-containing protein [Aspergillus steynii IBT 23096]
MTDATPSEPIAVVGLSLRLPGDANDLDGLWRLLESGEPAWTPVPEDRYNGEAFYHPSADDPNGTSNHPGGHFISGDIRDFDHTFFHFSKPQAAAIDPQQRLLMELAYEALESGGISRESVAGSATSVYAALFPTDYDRQLYKDPLDLPAYYTTGVEKAILSNRISHVLDLRGPSMTLDTACSGGLVALHLACQSLRAGESDTALVAASNLILGPDHAIGLSNLHMLSSTGRCYPFDDRGDGYGRGEGVVVLVLKRLETAIRDRNPIRTIIRGTAINQDGYTPQGITYPNGQAQADLARKAYAGAGLRPEEVAYIEAHGTGTKAGDKEELESIAEVFASASSRSGPLLVGSIKGAIGHTESTAGLASLLKATAMLEHELIPPVAGFANPKPGLPLDRIEVPTAVIPWPHTTGITPRVSINSFGFGGANAHAILERGPRTSRDHETNFTTTPRLFTLSANSSVSLKAMITAHHDWVRQRAERTPLADVSYTLLHRRSALPYRFSVVADDHASLAEALGQGVSLSATKPFPSELDLVAVFTGQGAQWAGMGRELLLESTPSSIFRDSIRASRAILHQLGATWNLEAELLRDSTESRLGEAELAQPATTAVQIALVALLRAQGVRPRAVVGHSSGEIAAAYTAGHISHETAIRVAYHRGFMAAAVKAQGLGRGAMLSVGLGERDASLYLDGLTKGTAIVACVNSPRSVTISGDADAVDEVERRIAAAENGTFHRKLLVDTAYHSHHMQAVADNYRARLGHVQVETTSFCRDGDDVAMYSSVNGQRKTTGFDEEYWTANLVSPVRFTDAVQALAKARHRPGQHVSFVEIGPHPALAGPVRQSLQAPEVPTLAFDYHATLQRKVGATASVQTLAGKLFERGVGISWDAVSALAPGADTAVVRHDLPAYTWDHSTKHWYESRVAHAYRQRKEPYHDLLGVRIPDATDIEPRWRHFLSRATLPWLEDHVVDGLTIFPGAGYVCMAIEAVAQLVRQELPHRSLETVALRKIAFKRGLVVPERGRVELQLSLQRQAGLDQAFRFTIMALPDGGDVWYEHATGIVEAVLADEDNDAITQASPEESPQLPPDSSTVPKEALYSDMDAVGNTYGPAFAGLDYLTVSGDASQGLSSFKILDIQASMPAQHQHAHVIHPSTLDIVFHTALPLVGRQLGPGSIMPVYIDELLISATPSLESPGSQLDISTLLTSSHFRTAVSDMSVFASRHRVLSIAGMEFRSLSSSLGGGTDAANTVNGTVDRKICYELDWKSDIDFARVEDLPVDPALADIIELLSLKRDRVLTIGLGASVDLSEGFLNAIQSNGSNTNPNKIVAHDFVDATPGRFDDAAERIKKVPIQFRTLRPGTNPVARGFEPGVYDIVLATSAKWLSQAAVLVSPGGIVLLVFNPRDSKDDTWRDKLEKTGDTPLEALLAFRDDAGRLIAVAKPAITQLPSNISILTHSTPSAALTNWVSALTKGLHARNVEVSLDRLGQDTVQSLPSNATVIVADDHADIPILNDPAAFDATSTLLRRPSRVVWVSPDDPTPFHQIEGVARTAHAENDDLRLTTVHAASTWLADLLGIERLIDVVVRAASHISHDRIPHIEREYRIYSNGAVVIPRLSRSETLNGAIADKSNAGPETQQHRFADIEQNLIISPNNPELFVVHNELQAAPLAADAVEVETQTFIISRPDSRAAVGPFVGVVTSVGANVNSLSPGDRVVALATVAGANRLRVLASHARRLSSNVPSTLASAILLDTMAASFALRDIARLLSSGGTVLVHGASTAAGRATIAVARLIGVRVIATATSSVEARLLKEQVGIDEANVLVARPSLHRRLPRDIFAEGLDAVIQTTDDAAPAEALAFIKPFGSVVVVSHPDTRVALPPKMPPNVGVHSIDITGLLQARPDLTASLLAAATVALEHIPLAHFNIPVRDVTEIAEALRLVNTGVHTKVVLQIGPESTVPVIPAAKPNPWALEDATYVIAGGLGDIGQRFLFRVAQRGAKHVATISRRAVDPDTRRSLEAKLEAIRPGIRLYTLQGDVTSESSVQAAAASLYRQGAPQVRGVIQGAVVMKDRPLELTTYEDFTTVTKIKVDGTLALHRVFASPDLAFFLSLSSISSLVGASAEASYNAGNAVQDALAHPDPNSSSQTRFITVNLGWSEGATLTVDDETRQGALRRAGFRLIGLEELIRFIDHVLGAAVDPGVRTPSHAIIGFDAESLADATAGNGTIHSALFSQVRDDEGKSLSADGADGGVSTGQTFEQAIAEGSEAVTDFISRTMTDQLARLISVDASSIDAQQGSIMALGLDSLVAVELRNWITRQFEAPLQSSEILVNQTVHGLAEKVATRSKLVGRTEAAGV